MQVSPGGGCNLSTHARERVDVEGQQLECAQHELNRRAVRVSASAVASIRRLALCALVWATSAASAHADEPWLLHLEATLGTPVANPQRDWYGLGGGLAAGVTRPLASWLALEGQLRGGLFLDGDKPKSRGVKDPGLGTLNTAAVGVLLRLPDGSLRRGTGPWVAAMIGAALTGSEVRASWEAGLGYGFAVGERFALGPVIRYLQVIQPDGGLSSSDARIVLAGLRMSLFDHPPEHAHQLRPTAKDRDGDGVPDSTDKCIDVPEDLDAFADQDGCPEDDNDNDGIPDARDGCPNIAEDKDGFQDEDGCVDDDNDRDGILDKDDQCPLEPETINGERDDDGCPDQGLIVMNDDRVLLQERLLFDTNRSHIKRSAEPILRAVVKLQSQHPEWTKVRIEGHADQRGDAKFNQDISERRATAAREALVSLGMPASLIVAEGYGASKPISQEPTEEGFAMNRRVEFVVIARHEDASTPMFTPSAPAAAPAPQPGVMP